MNFCFVISLTSCAEIYAKIRKRMYDEESIKKLVNEVFKSIWFSPISDKNPVKLQQRIFSIADVIHSLGHDQKCNNWVLYLIIFVGLIFVGKTSIIKRFCNDEFQTDGLASTIGVDFQIKSIRVDGYFVALQLWDTAGQERFRSITSHYYRKADGVVMVYDILSEQSLINLRQWMENVKEVVEDETVILVLANKYDMIQDEHEKNEANRLKSILNVENVLYFHCSAKTGENIMEAFQIMAKNLTCKENNDLKTSIKLENNNKKGCCKR